MPRLVAVVVALLTAAPAAAYGTTPAMAILSAAEPGVAAEAPDAAAAVTPADRLAVIQVQGNQLTPDAEIAAMAGLVVGMEADEGLADRARDRLRATGRFRSVEVLRRYASISDATQITLVILIDEGAVSVMSPSPGGDGEPTVRKRRGPPLMFWPILDYEDGYGLAYGVRTTIPNPAGRGSRLTFPVSWGARKSAAGEFEKPLTGPVLSRFQIGTSYTQRTHLYYDTDEDRARVWGRVERDLPHHLRVAGGLATESVSLFDVTEQMTTAGANVALDTRIDPWLPGNAAYGRAAWDHLSFQNHPSAERLRLEARGYLATFHHSVLMARIVRDDSDRQLPDYERPLLGGIPTVRGFSAGSVIGDTLTAAQLELRLPLTSPLSVGKLGVSAFFDAGTIYDKGERLSDQVWERGTGGGVWLSATVFRLSLYVAHGLGGSTRVQTDCTIVF